MAAKEGLDGFEREMATFIAASRRQPNPPPPAPKA